MKLEFLLVPTADFDASLAFYRDVVGCTEAWREGDSTAALMLPGSDVQVMLDASDPDAPAGPILVVESVADFEASRPAGLELLDGPTEIPDGFMATYREPGGAIVYLLDQSTASTAS